MQRSDNLVDNITNYIVFRGRIPLPALPALLRLAKLLLNVTTPKVLNSVPPSYY
jgi:hypothetical protein